MATKPTTVSQEIKFELTKADTKRGFITLGLSMTLYKSSVRVIVKKEPKPAS
jgi:hypothetical protein